MKKDWVGSTLSFKLRNQSNFHFEKGNYISFFQNIAHPSLASPVRAWDILLSVIYVDKKVLDK